MDCGHFFAIRLCGEDPRPPKAHSKPTESLYSMRGLFELGADEPMAIHNEDSGLSAQAPLPNRGIT